MEIFWIFILHKDTVDMYFNKNKNGLQELTGKILENIIEYKNKG